VCARTRRDAEGEGRRCILERGIVTELALVRAHQADREGNLRYQMTAQNFNPLVAAAGLLTIVEAEEVIDGHLDPDEVVTPGVFVQCVVTVANTTKNIEQRTLHVREEV